jgi:hypothetical protein
MFIIEGMGFGRGLGALDLNKDRIEDYMHMLDATKLNEDAADAIKAAFAPLRDRDVLIVADELERPDRQNFDDAVLAALAPGLERERIYEALLSLVEIRRTAVE